MNFVFFAAIALCGILTVFSSPEGFLSALTSGATEAVSLFLSLLAINLIWLGFLQIVEDSSLLKKFSTFLSPVVKKLFMTDEEKTVAGIAGALSANALGLGNAATLYALDSVKLLDKHKHRDYLLSLFFVLNASSLQILPTTVITLRQNCGSVAAFDIFLPSLITSFFSTLLSFLLVKIFISVKNR